MTDLFAAPAPPAVDPRWPARYVGRPYAADGDGNCWGLVRLVQRETFGRELPFQLDPHTALGCAKTLRDHPERRRWRRIDDPTDGDLVGLSQAEAMTHVGVWARCDGGGVLHSLAGAGAVFQSLSALSLMRWRVVGFYRCEG